MGENDEPTSTKKTVVMRISDRQGELNLKKFTLFKHYKTEFIGGSRPFSVQKYNTPLFHYFIIPQ